MRYSGSEPVMIEDRTILTDKERAPAILALCKDKPIKVMTAADYAYRNAAIKARKKKHEWGDPNRDDQATTDRKNLAKRCIALLTDGGAMTTQQLARETRCSARSVSCALGEVPGIMSEQQVAAVAGPTGHRSREVLWMMPVRM